MYREWMVEGGGYFLRLGCWFGLVWSWMDGWLVDWLVGFFITMSAGRDKRAGAWYVFVVGAFGREEQTSPVHPVLFLGGAEIGEADTIRYGLFFPPCFSLCFFCCLP